MSQKDTDTNSLCVCAQQSLHFLLYVGRLDVLQEKLGYVYCHGSAICIVCAHTHTHTHTQNASNGHRPASTLAIKKEGDKSIWPCTFKKIYSKDKVAAFFCLCHFDQRKGKIAFQHASWANEDGRALFICKSLFHFKNCSFS